MCVRQGRTWSGSRGERRWGVYSGIDLRVCPPSVTVMNVNVTLYSIQKLGLDTPVV